MPRGRWPSGMVATVERVSASSSVMSPERSLLTQIQAWAGAEALAPSGAGRSSASNTITIRTIDLMRSSLERIEVAGDVARVGFADAQVRHRGERIDPGRVADPAHHVHRVVGQHAGDVGALRDPGERR